MLNRLGKQSKSNHNFSQMQKIQSALWIETEGSFFKVRSGPFFSGWFIFAKISSNSKLGVLFLPKFLQNLDGLVNPFWTVFWSFSPCKTPKNPKKFRALRAQFSWGVFIFANSQPYFFWFFHFCQNLTKCFMGVFYLGGVLIFIPPVILLHSVLTSDSNAPLGTCRGDSDIWFTGANMIN